ncbi:cell envelope integrity protein TolA [Paraglaciecola sp.]|uniref:cell envelope integrity protein TolA n=1 Tax=Paraglaciecola sp. TaxID=1920173 RepID=UPI003EFA3DBD
MSKLSVWVVLSIVLHVILVTVLLIGGSLRDPKPTPELSMPGPIIEAVAIDESVLKKQAQKIENEKRQERLKEQKRLKDIERRKKEVEDKRKKKIADAAALKKKKAQELKDKKQAEQAAIAAREKLKKEKAKAKKLEDERKRKAREKKKADDLAKKAKEKREKAEKARKDAERKKQQEAKEKAAQEKALQDQLKEEQAARQQRRNKQVLTELQKYEAMIKQVIQRNMIVDDVMRGKSCRFNIRLASNGLVIQVKELGGDALVCRAGKTAILKADTLPVSSEPDVYEKMRNINFTFAPEL